MSKPTKPKRASNMIWMSKGRPFDTRPIVHHPTPTEPVTVHVSSNGEAGMTNLMESRGYRIRN